MQTTISPAKPKTEIITEDQKYPVCPWCGFEHNEPYRGQFDDEGIEECENCGNSFDLIFVHHFTTKKVVKDGAGYRS